jgi:hypothetical protein
MGRTRKSTLLDGVSGVPQRGRGVARLIDSDNSLGHVMPAANDFESPLCYIDVEP